MSTGALDLHDGLAGSATIAMRRFYDRLPSMPPERRPELLEGLGYNFEFYDALFPLMLANVQLSMDEGDYTARYRAVQALIRPYCSEFGFDPGSKPKRTHRQLYAEFFEQVTGRALPERYPADGANQWLDVSRRWAARMKTALERPGRSALDRARFNAGYFWAVEHLSVEEMDLLAEAWRKAGFRADYLDAHCQVEGEHDRWSVEGVSALAPRPDPEVRRGVAEHEEHLAGFYDDLTRLSEARPAAAAPAPRPLAR